jgi:hypothetical protein
LGILIRLSHGAATVIPRPANGILGFDSAITPRTSGFDAGLNTAGQGDGVLSLPYCCKDREL